MREKSKQLCALAVALLCVAGCEAAEHESGPVEVVGRLEDAKIREASGLARSQRQEGVLWIINDNGAKEIVHAIDHSGARLGEFDLKKSKNRDWEDLASMRRDDQPILMVADIGDNHARRGHRTLYFVVEPVPEKDGKAKLDWQVDYVYPDGPRDAESAAIDTANERALILSKRDLPPQLYEVPLRSETEDKVEAVFLGDVLSLRRPTRQQFETAPMTDDYFWQPVGMDISADNNAAVILTYADVYYYERDAEETWLQALNSEPVRVGLGNFKNAEAIAFGDDQRTVFVTGENKHSRLLRIDFADLDMP